MLILVGVMFDESGVEHDECISIIPPRPITKCIYKCDKRFYVEYLVDLYKDYDCHGVVFITGSGCSFYKLSGASATLLERFKVKLPNEHSRGGQSQNRISHLRDEAIHNYITKCNERVLKHYTENGTSSIKKLAITGPAEKKILLQNRIAPYLKDICKTATYSTETEMLDKISSLFLEENEDSKITEFREMFNMASEKIVYGKKKTLKKLEHAMIQILLVDENNMDDEIAQLCNDYNVEIINTCNNDIEKITGGYAGILWY